MRPLPIRLNSASGVFFASAVLSVWSNVSPSPIKAHVLETQPCMYDVRPVSVGVAYALHVRALKRNASTLERSFFYRWHEIVLIDPQHRKP